MNTPTTGMESFFTELSSLLNALRKDFDSMMRNGKAGANLSRRDVRFLVDTYYQIQEFRKASGNQERAAGKHNEPHRMISEWFKLYEMLEDVANAQLRTWSNYAGPEGQWAQQITGIGHVLAAGLSAFIDMDKATTVSKVWRIAGQDASVRWLGADKAEKMVKDVFTRLNIKKNYTAAFAELALLTNRKVESLLLSAKRLGKGKITKDSIEKAVALRPWNARFKTLCWKIGDSFVKCQNRGSYYGFIYAEKKAEYVAKNDAGEYAEVAAEKLASKSKFSAHQRAVMKEGKLPDIQIDLRARRKAIKLFLSHYWVMAYRSYYHKEPPAPYIIQHGGHVDYVSPEHVLQWETDEKARLKEEAA